MSDVLSQNQIDELLSSLSKGDTPLEQPGSKRVKEYDFKSPKKLSKEQLKTLTGMYETFARHLASYFSGILRFFCEVSVTSIEELPYYEYNNSLPDSLIIGVLKAKPIEGNLLADFSNIISFTLIDRLLGGNGTGVIPNREFTEIEVTLMERIFRQMAAFTKDAWPHTMNMESSFEQIETNARLVQSMSMDEVVAIIVLDVKMGTARGTINICIPCINLESVIDQINQNQYHSKRSLDAEHEELIKGTMLSHVKGSPMEIEGVFGQTVLTLREVLNLQVGDVISFDNSVDKNIKLNIGGRTWFYGSLGTKRNKKAVKISKVL